jgi:hypothetical protein
MGIIALFRQHPRGNGRLVAHSQTRIGMST